MNTEIETIKKDMREMCKFYQHEERPKAIIESTMTLLKEMQHAYPNHSWIKERFIHDNYNLLWTAHNRRIEFIELCNSISAHHLITITSTFNLSEKSFISNCNKLLTETNLKLFKNYNKKMNKNDHINGLVILERGRSKSNIHAHLIVKDHEQYGSDAEFLKEKIEKSTYRVNGLYHKKIFDFEKGIDIKSIYSNGLYEYLSKETDRYNSNFAILDFNGIQGHVSRQDRRIV